MRQRIYKHVIKMRFSIIIANYNSGRLLEECINSVLSQDFSDYELILVDADSTDESKTTVLKYQQYFSWWCSEKDNGQSDAFNKGFSHAKGDFFFWLNADDFLLPHALYQASKFIDEHPNCFWVTFNTIFVDINRKVLFVNNAPQWIQTIMKRIGPQVDAPTSIFHHTMFEQSQKFDVNLYYAMDIDLWLQFMNLGYRYRRLNYYFYAFRIHKGSKTANEGYNKKTKNSEKIRQGHLIQIKNSFFPQKYKSWIFLNKLIKLFCYKPYSVVNTIKLKGKQI